MSFWYNSVSGRYTILVDKFKWDFKTKTPLDLSSNGKTLYELIDNARYYVHSAESQFFDEAIEREAEDEIKRLWREYHGLEIWEKLEVKDVKTRDPREI